jgi:hypothetical protein
MSSDNTRFNDEDFVVLVPVSKVQFYFWDEDMGNALKKLREGRFSRPDVERISGKKVTQHYLQKLENGDARAVSRDKLLVILDVLGASELDIISGCRIDVTNFPFSGA